MNDYLDILDDDSPPYIVDEIVANFGNIQK